MRTVHLAVVSAHVILVTLVLMAASGCGKGSTANERINRQNAEKVHIGSSLADVEAILGPGHDAVPADVPDEAKGAALTWKTWERGAGSRDRIVVGFDANGLVQAKSQVFFDK